MPKPTLSAAGARVKAVYEERWGTEINDEDAEALAQAALEGLVVVADTKKARLSAHPAIQAYRAQAKTYPDSSQMESVIAKVGDAPDALEFWGKVVAEYCLLGWNKRNIKNMLEYFERKELPMIQGGGSGKQSRREQQRVAERQELANFLYGGASGD